MEVGLWGGLVLGVVVVLGLREVMVATALLKLGFRPVRARNLAADEVSPAVQEAFAVAERWLKPHGFRVLGFMEGFDLCAPPGADLPPALLLADDRGTLAQVLFQLPCDSATPFHILFHTLFRDGSAVVTANALEHTWLGDPAGRASQHVWTTHLEEQLDKHRAGTAERTAQGEAREQLDLDEVSAWLVAKSNELLAKLIADGVVHQDAASGASHFGLAQAFARGRRHIQGMARAAGLRKERAALIKAGTLEALERVPVEIEIAGAELARLFQEGSLPKRSGRALFAASMVLSTLGALIWLDAQVVLALFITLFIHEAGHYVAMRLCGHSDAKVFFVPMVGAVTVARPRPTSTTQEVLILLAGPVPGLLLALALTLWPIAALGSFAKTLIFWLAALNFFNLLPVTPLDGGKIFARVVLGKNPYAGFAFSVFSALVLAVLCVLTGDGILLGFLVLLALGWPRQWRTAKLKRLLGTHLAGPFSKERLVRAFSLLSEDKRLAGWDKLRVIHSLAPHWGRTHARWPVRLAWGSGYILCLLGSAALLPFVLDTPSEARLQKGEPQSFSCLAPNIAATGADGVTFSCPMISVAEPAFTEELRVYSRLRWELPCLRAPWQYSAADHKQRQRDLELRSWVARRAAPGDNDDPLPEGAPQVLPEGLDDTQRTLLTNLTSESWEREELARSVSALLGERQSCDWQAERRPSRMFAAYVDESELHLFTVDSSAAELNEMASFLCREGQTSCSFTTHSREVELAGTP